MSDDRIIIMDSIRKVRKIYEQISVLIETTDGLMKSGGWEALSSTVVRGSSQAYYLPQQWLPSVLTRGYRHKGSINKVLLMGVMLDHEEIDEPLIVGTSLSVPDEKVEFPYVSHYDSCYWFLKCGKESSSRESVVIANPGEVYAKEDRELDCVMTFAVPLLEITDSEQLLSRFVGRLLGSTS